MKKIIVSILVMLIGLNISAQQNDAQLRKDFMDKLRGNIVPEYMDLAPWFYGQGGAAAKENDQVSNNGRVYYFIKSGDSYKAVKAGEVCAVWSSKEPANTYWPASGPDRRKEIAALEEGILIDTRGALALSNKRMSVTVGAPLLSGPGLYSALCPGALDKATMLIKKVSDPNKINLIAGESRFGFTRLQRPDKKDPSFMEKETEISGIIINRFFTSFDEHRNPIMNGQTPITLIPASATEAGKPLSGPSTKQALPPQVPPPLRGSRK